jgi:hypothetical protein
MNKNYAIAFACSLTFLSAAFAQERKHCFTTEMYNQKMLENPVEMKESEDDLNQFTRNFELTHGNQNQTSNTILIIPVVFHVIHDYGAENISDDQILDAVAIMNRDYRKQNADTNQIIPAFQGMATDIEVEFRLATLDPAGNCTNGIERIASYRTHNADDYSKLHAWPNNMYLNIWTVNDFGPNHEGAAAYSYYPNNGINDTIDGVISLASYVGSIGTSSGGTSRTLTHEIGHFLNLQHPWGNTNDPGVACGDDGVGDTPLTKGWDHCPVSNFDICTAGVDENFQNYMDYSYCDVMFTPGQKTRMIAALNSPIQNRNNLWTTANLIATGTNGSAPLSCAPKVDFAPKYNHICNGDSVMFIPVAYNADSLTYSWSFPSGTPSSSTLETPVVHYPGPGSYDATLTVTAPGGNVTLTKAAVITVDGGPTLSAIYTDDFETAGTFPGNGYIENNDNSSLWKWARITGITGASGTAAIKMRNSGTNHVGEFDTWVTDAFDLSNITLCQVKFKLAYSNYNIQKVETLKVSYSIDCGKTWSVRYTKYGSTGAPKLTTVTTAIPNFSPTSPAQWRQETANMYPASGYTNVRFKFEFESGGTTSSGYGDNNLYIDDLNITGTLVGIDEVAKQELGFSIAPNPAAENTKLSFTTTSTTDVVINVLNNLGQQVLHTEKKNLIAGSQEVTLNTAGLNAGIYFVQLQTGTVVDSKKLIVQ